MVMSVLSPKILMSAHHAARLPNITCGRPSTAFNLDQNPDKQLRRDRGSQSFRIPLRQQWENWPSTETTTGALNEATHAEPRCGGCGSGNWRLGAQNSITRSSSDSGPRTPLFSLWASVAVRLKRVPRAVNTGLTLPFVSFTMREEKAGSPEIDDAQCIL
jgi:hypothetical protein